MAARVEEFYERDLSEFEYLDRLLPMFGRLHECPPWNAVSQQERPWMAAMVFEKIAHELRVVMRLFDGRHEHPTAAIFDALTLQSTPESGGRAGCDGHKKKNGSKIHIPLDPVSRLLSLFVMPCNAVNFRCNVRS